MEFKINMSEETFEKIKEALINMDCEFDCEFDTPEEYIKELFFLEDRRGEISDVRDEVNVEEV